MTIEGEINQPNKQRKNKKHRNSVLAGHLLGFMLSRVTFTTTLGVDLNVLIGM